MKTRFQLTENEKTQIKKLYISEEKEIKDDRKFCHSGNVKSLDEIVGNEEFEDYIDGVKIRKNGMNGIVDRLELLKTIRLHPKISDGGEHLAFEVMNNLKSFKPYNYFEESRKECNRAMDKIIELYKENDHGEELVKDIEKIYRNHHVSPRAKEFIKHSLNIIKGQ